MKTTITRDDQQHWQSTTIVSTDLSELMEIGLALQERLKMLREFAQEDINDHRWDDSISRIEAMIAQLKN